MHLIFLAQFFCCVSRRCGPLLSPSPCPPPIHFLCHKTQWQQLSHTTIYWQKLKGKYEFDNYLILTQLLRDGTTPEVLTDGKKKKKKHSDGAGGGGPANGTVTWLKAEDECFSNQAHAAFEFAIAKEPQEGFHFFGKVMLVQANKLKAVRDEVLELVGDEALRNEEK